MLETCKSHGGPVTPQSLNVLDSLNTKQLVNEVAYLRATIAPDIKQKRRIRLQSGKFKMENFSDNELRVNIKNVIQPESEAVDSIKNLLKDVFKVKT